MIMTTLEEIVNGMLEKIHTCQRKGHAHQPRTAMGTCDHCLRWEVELLVMGRDPKTGAPQGD